MPLITEQKIYRCIDVFVLEEFIKTILDIDDYNLVAIEGYRNDSYHTFSVENQLATYYQEEWDNFKAKKTDNVRLKNILNGLCADGHIEAGDYLVEICW